MTNDERQSSSSSRLSVIKTLRNCTGRSVPHVHREEQPSFFLVPGRVRGPARKTVRKNNASYKINYSRLFFALSAICSGYHRHRWAGWRQILVIGLPMTLHGWCVHQIRIPVVTAAFMQIWYLIAFYKVPGGSSRRSGLRDTVSKGSSRFSNRNVVGPFQMLNNCN